MTQPTSKRLLTEARLGAANGAAAVGTDGKLSTPLPDLTSTYARAATGRRRDPRIFHAIPAVHPAPPTVAYSAGGSSPLASPNLIPFNSPTVTTIGCQPVDNNSQNYRENIGASPWAIEFDHYGSDLVFQFRGGQSGTSGRIWIWVDDQPLTAAPDPMTALGSLTGGGYYRARLTWGTAAMRRVRIYLNIIQFNSLEVLKTATVSPTGKPATSIAVYGDSFVGGGGGILGLEAFPQALGQLLGWEVYNFGQGSTGYTTPGVLGGKAFADPARLATVASAKPKVVLIVGSCNDDGATYAATNAAAASTFAQLATLLPGVPVVLVGPQPTDVTTTFGVNRATSRDAVRDAALAAPNVVSFTDPVGMPARTVTMPAFAAGVTYAVGDVVSYAGGVYACTEAHTSVATPVAGFNESRMWKLLSWYTGTGRVGTLAGDGNRDLFLNADGTHPSPAGNDLWARRCAGAVLGSFTY